MTPLLLLSLCLGADPSGAEGIRPLGANGKPLNLDFETGTLADWTAEGEAFRNQPIKGDTVAPRRKDMKSNHQGDYWIGTFENGNGDKPTGTLTSTDFKVTHPFASFLIGGGKLPGTRVEILLASSGDVIRQAHGTDHEAMQRVVLNLSKYVGEKIQIRVLDEATKGWGHINFDDFLFHAEEPKFAGARRLDAPAAALGEIPNAGLTPQKAAEAMTVPEGFHVTLFAGEPDVHQPIAFCFDDRGRLWVVEAYTYPKRHPHPGPILPEKDRHLGDRVVIIEDVNGDGKHDKRTVFIEGLNLVSGIEYGFGGIYIGAAPYLLHIPIKDDKPAGEPVILLDGWGYEDTHETLNSFIWGPDGWLYGCHGVFTHSKVGKPGTPEKDRVKINAGVWRYHPTRHLFEVFAHGTSNPWGLDYNQHGDFFVSACVIPHLFHIVQGGRYQRQAGEHFNKHTYIDIPTIADHLHYQGNQWNENDRKGSDDAGGGHAHCGLMCYQGGAWPKEYHGQLFMGNIHGRRINMDTLHPKGSTYVARHGKDFLLANDAWARFIALKYGPDGNVYLIDWYDKQACHRTEPEVWDRTNGRIYKISYRGTQPVTNLDLQKCTNMELVKYQRHENEWYARHARRIIQERAEKMEVKQLQMSAFTTLWAHFVEETDVHLKLRALWCYYSAGLFDEHVYAHSTLHEDSQHARGWLLYLTMQWSHVLYPELLDQGNWRHRSYSQTSLDNWRNTDKYGPIFARYAAAAGASPQISPGRRVFLLKFPLEHLIGSNQLDDNMRALIWNAMEADITSNPNAATVLLYETVGDELLHRLILRRLLSIQDNAMARVVFRKMYEELDDPKRQTMYLECLADSSQIWIATGDKDFWKGIREKVVLSSNEKLLAAAFRLDIAYRNPEALAELRNRASEQKLPMDKRIEALSLLLGIEDADTINKLGDFASEPPLRAVIVRSATILPNQILCQSLLATVPTMSSSEKRAFISLLATKQASAHWLLEAIDKKHLVVGDVPAETIRQLRSFNDPALNAKVVSVWGTLRDTPADRKKLMTEWRRKLTLTHDPDLPAGRAVFAKVCAQCHTLYGVGSNIGPDITGSDRANLNYLLENIFDPSAVIPKEYTATTFDLADGRRITGIVKEDGPQIVVATATETVRFSVDDVEQRKPSELSMMPDDLMGQLSDDEVRNLFWYLRYPRQVPMKATADNSRELFNGVDLTGWDGSREIWTVENGEIVGRTTEPLKRNSFLMSHLEVRNFRLTLKVKLTPDAGNSGIQFRSVPIDGGEMRGPQADIGKGWWGKLYEESGRGLLAKEGGERFVKPGEWNDYVIEAVGPRVTIHINGELACDYTDDKLARRGIIGLQVHSGPPMEVRFRDIKLEVLPEN